MMCQAFSGERQLPKLANALGLLENDPSVVRSSDPDPLDLVQDAVRTIGCARASATAFPAVMSGR
jgi:hypothetical protein